MAPRPQAPGGSRCAWRPRGSRARARGWRPAELPRLRVIGAAFPLRHTCRGRAPGEASGRQAGSASKGLAPEEDAFVEHAPPTCPPVARGGRAARPVRRRRGRPDCQRCGTPPPTTGRAGRARRPQTAQGHPSRGEHIDVAVGAGARIGRTSRYDGAGRRGLDRLRRGSQVGDHRLAGPLQCQDDPCGLVLWFERNHGRRSSVTATDDAQLDKAVE